MQTKNNFKQLMDFAGNRRWLTYVALILSSCSAIMGLIPFLYIWKIMEEIVSAMPRYQDAENLSYYGIMAFIFTASSIVVYIAGLMCSHLAAFHVAGVIRKRLIRHVATLPEGAVMELGTGKVRKIIDECSAASENYLAHTLPDLAGSATTPVMVFIVMLIFDWKLGLLCLIPVFCAFLFMQTMRSSTVMQKNMELYNTASANMSNEAVEYVRGIAVIKTFGQTVFSFASFKATIDAYKQFCTAYAKSARFPLVGFVTSLNAIFVVLIFAGLLYMNYNTEYKAFLLDLIFYVIFTPVLVVLVTKVMYEGQNSMIVDDALRRINGLFALKPLPVNAPTSPAPTNYDIKLDGVSFSYAETETLAIDNVSLNIPEGKTIAFVGASGSGKTTIASLIARFWDPQKGQISIGGVDVKNIKEADRNSMIAYVFQHNTLLKTSIFENIKLAKPTATLAEITKVLSLAQCDDIIAKLPQGIHSIIGSKGVYLSGGEMQRLAIARALLKDAPIIILDEATAFADPENEERIYQSFEALAHNKTVILIAHRLSTVVKADQIYLMEHGRIIEHGTHTELCEQNRENQKIGQGIYQRMWKEYASATTWNIRNTQPLQNEQGVI